jgi:hypothetical protein
LIFCQLSVYNKLLQIAGNAAGFTEEWRADGGKKV